jgi:tetratricopeptide (TPR) repeat protein
MQEQRLNFLEKEILAQPNEPFNYYALALEYIKIDKEKALNLFEYLLKEHSEYLPVYYKSAEFFEENNEIEKADDIFKKGILLAEKLGKEKILKELKGRYQLFIDENEF